METSKEKYQSFDVENPESVKNLEKLAQQGKIEKIFPSGNEKSIMHMYKTDGFNIASYLHGDQAKIEISRYSNDGLKMEEKINYLEEVAGIKLIENGRS
jgi:hypothetical protein